MWFIISASDMVKCYFLAWFLLPLSYFSASVFPSDEPLVFTKNVYATYYASKFEGRKTTSGERYRKSKLTAAHLTLPFGTLVTVTNPENGKSVTVKINDRGPHSKKFSIDLSERAAREIGIFRKGSALVEMSYSLESE